IKNSKQLTQTKSNGRNIYLSSLLALLTCLSRGETMKKNLSNAKKRESRQFFIYTSPWILGFLIFTLYPVVYSVILVFTNADMTGSGSFIGFENIKMAFTQDPLFYKSMVNTLYFVAVSVPLSLLLSVFIAILLNKKNIKGMWIFRTAFYVPFITAGVAVTLLWG